MDNEKKLWITAAGIGAAGFLAGLAHNPLAAEMCGLASCLFAIGNIITNRDFNDEAENDAQ